MVENGASSGVYGLVYMDRVSSYSRRCSGNDVITVWRQSFVVVVDDVRPGTAVAVTAASFSCQTFGPTIGPQPPPSSVCVDRTGRKGHRPTNRHRSDWRQPTDHSTGTTQQPRVRLTWRHSVSYDWLCNVRLLHIMQYDTTKQCLT